MCRNRAFLSLFDTEYVCDSDNANGRLRLRLEKLRVVAVAVANDDDDGDIKVRRNSRHLLAIRCDMIKEVINQSITESIEAKLSLAL